MTLSIFAGIVIVLILLQEWAVKHKQQNLPIGQHVIAPDKHIYKIVSDYIPERGGYITETLTGGNQGFIMANNIKFPFSG